MLREDIEQYTKLTGKDGWSVPIIKIGAYLDGYNKGLAVLEKIRAEIENVTPKAKFQTGKTSIDVQMMIPQEKVLQIIDKYMAESEVGTRPYALELEDWNWNNRKG